MYPQQKEIVLFGVDDKPLKAFVPEIKIRMNKGKAFDVNRITTSKDGYDILKRIYGRNPIQENFIVLLMNRGNKVIGYYKHTIGSSYATIADIPMIVGLATKAIAHGVIISHNHPSGTLMPSDPDKELTKNLTKALETVKINLLDHIIFTNEGYYSFADQGILNGVNDTIMITVNNLISQYPAINQAVLPDTLKADEFEFIRENIDLYDEDETIKKYIDTFVEKLNVLVSKQENTDDYKSDEPRKHKLSDIPAIVKKFMPKFQQDAIVGSEEHFEIVERLEREINAIPKNTNEADKAIEKARKTKNINYKDFYTVYAHFFYGGSDWFVLSWDRGDLMFCYVILNGDTQMSEMGDISLTELNDNRVELDFFWKVKSLSRALYEAYPDEFPEPGESEKQPEPKEKPVQKKEEAKTKQPAKEKEHPGTPVEKMGLEVSFIKRYVGLHGKTREKQQILNFLNSLQKAILEKRIRKTSTYAKEIMNIQQQLIKCYQNMGNTVQVNIDQDILESYSTIANSEKTMLSIIYIKQYIGLHGKQGVKEKAKKLLDRIEKAINSSKITKDCPYWDEVSEIVTSLEHYLGNKTKAPEIQESTLNGIMTWLVKKQLKKQMARQINKQSPDGLQGIEDTPEIISSTQLPKMQFETIGLTGKYKDLIGDPSVGFSAMIFGLPKSGKSTLSIDFARHLAENHGKVLYVAIEEGFGYTLKEKFERLNAMHPNLVIAEKLPDDLSAFKFVFIDSVSKARLTSQDLTRLRKKNPGTAFIFIFHTTKDGNFRGQQDFAHDVDVIIEVENGVAKANGRFGVGGSARIFD